MVTKYGVVILLDLFSPFLPLRLPFLPFPFHSSIPPSVFRSFRSSTFQNKYSVNPFSIVQTLYNGLVWRSLVAAFLGPVCMAAKNLTFRSGTGLRVYSSIGMLPSCLFVLYLWFILWQTFS